MWGVLLFFVAVTLQDFVINGYPSLYGCSRETFDTGITVMGEISAFSSLRVMQVSRDGVALSSGDEFNPGEVLSVTMSDLSGQQLLEVSGGAEFTGGSCDCNCRYYGGSTDVTMPTDDSDVNIWGGWATTYGLVSVTAKFLLVSSGVPVTESPTLSTTTSPTISDHSSFSLLFSVSSSNVTTSQLQSNVDDLTTVFCTHLSLTPSLCIITFISESETAVDVQFDLLVTDFESQVQASDATSELQQYLLDTTATGFIEEFYTASGLRFSVAVYQSSEVTESSVSNLYAYSCDLSDSLKLSWRVESQGDGVSTGEAGGYVTGSITMLSGGSTPWFAAGVVADNSLSMVTTPEHVVYFFEPNSQQAGMYRINAYSSSGVIADTRIRDDTGISGVHVADSATSIDFQQSRYTDVTVDPVLALDSVEEFNTIMWAHGGVWPSAHAHSPSGRGFATVYWLEGACVAQAENEFDDGKWFFLYVAVLLIVAIFAAHLDRTALKDFRVVFHLRRTLRQLLPSAIPLTDDMAAFTLRSSIAVAIFIAIVGIFLKQAANYYEDEMGYDTDRAYSFSLGHTALSLAALTTIPVNRTGIIVTLFRIPFDRATKFHRVCASLTIILVVVHAIKIADFWGSSDVITFDTAKKVGEAYPAYGLLAVCCFGAMALTAPFPMRSRLYELFQMVHLLFVPALVFIILHVSKYGKRALFFPLVLVALDWLMRIYQAVLPVENVSIDSPYSRYTVLTVKASHIREVEPGQFCYVNIAAASLFQWHPISICSYDRETGEVTFIIKNVGDWTAKICDVVNSTSSDATVLNDFRVRLCGPYGRIRFDLGADKDTSIYHYEKLILVAGGIGCTPMISTLQWLMDDANDRGNEHRVHVTFLITARDREMFSLFGDYFKIFNGSKVFQKGGLDLRLYCTTDQRGQSETSGQNALEIQTLRTSEVDPNFGSSVTNVAVPITYGRPDIGKEIETVCDCRETATGKVCVLACGPAGIVTAVQKGCYQAIQKFGPVVDLHEESFRI